MAYDGLKTPFATSANRLAQRRAFDAIQLLGKALPCTIVSIAGQIVTVSFAVNSGGFTLPHVTVPLKTSKYDWLPLQPGDQGIVEPADVYLGGISGLGGGSANLTAAANLEALVFVPVSNAAWAAPGDDPNVRVVQGPNGVQLQDIAATATVKIGNHEISMNAGGHSIVINSSGVTIDGKVFLTHMHGGVQTGSGDTGPVA